MKITYNGIKFICAVRSHGDPLLYDWGWEYSTGHNTWVTESASVALSFYPYLDTAAREAVAHLILPTCLDWLKEKYAEHNY